MERKLATIRQVAEIIPIEGADKICQYRVDGWKVVDGIGKYQVDSLVVFLEIDSWVPTELAPFLSKGKEPKVFNGIQGERLKTIKLKGALSQGLILPFEGADAAQAIKDWSLDQLFEETAGEHIKATGGFEGADVTAILGIQLWEAPIPAGMQSQMKGNFPHFLRKTDQNRVQNIGRELEKYIGESFEVSIKLDGSSLTAYVNGEDEGVCSRNIDLKEVEGNAFWDIVRKERLLEKLRSTGRNLAIQGELVSPTIQANYEKVKKPEFYCFNIFDIDAQEYLLPEARQIMCGSLGIPHVPVVDGFWILESSDIDAILAMADGPGMNPGVMREGLVFKHNRSEFSWKAISNTYLYKKDK